MTWMFIEWLKTGKPTVAGRHLRRGGGPGHHHPGQRLHHPDVRDDHRRLRRHRLLLRRDHLKQKLGYDDSLDAFGVHGVSGVLGTP